MIGSKTRQRGEVKPQRLKLFVVALLAFGAGIYIDALPIEFRRSSTSSANASLPENLDYTSVEEVYDLLRKDYDGTLDQTALLDGIKAGLAEAVGDEYTEYYNATGAEQLNGDLNGTFFGIGAELGKENDNLIVVAPLEGYPAQKAGVRSRDVIAEINGESTAGMSVETAVSKIRGEVNTVVKLRLIRDGTQEISLDITRQQIQIESVKSEVLEGNIGYIRITRFDQQAPELTKKAANDLKSKGVTGVVLDLRSNPGGYLDASVDIAGLWVPNKPIVSEKNGDVTIKTYKSKNNAVLEGMKTVVLIDEGSASASEILAGALKDYGAAKLVGTKSFGKGVVQKLENLSETENGILKVTVARWFTPNGNTIDKQGIEPDVMVELSEDDIANKVDTQRNKAIEVLRSL